MKIFSKSESETEQAGEFLARFISPGSVVAMFGDLGAGKTAFVRGFARGMGYTGRVTSPTYSLVNEYLAPIPVFHFDMYRLEGEDDLFDIGWEDYLGRGGICIAEWCERIRDALPPESIFVTIEKSGENNRIITIEGADIENTRS